MAVSKQSKSNETYENYSITNEEEKKKILSEMREQIIKKRSHFKAYIILGYALVLAVWGVLFQLFKHYRKFKCKENNWG